ncbi:MAG: ribonuclease E/G [Acetobacteraceae bacterium]|nr:ribonuclease E/G [Acetobacteraceae bacterium]
MDHPVTIHVSSSPGERRIAASRDGLLIDYAIWRPGAPDGVGDLHVGRIIARAPAMAGSFVGLQDATGFLPDSESPPGLTEGQLLLVRITRAAQSGKGPRLTACQKTSLTPGPVRLVRRGPTPLDDLIARYPGAPVLNALFLPDLEDQIDTLTTSETPLPHGGRIHIHPTPALTAIDIDAAHATADRKAKPASQASFNRAILPELARQIRLRNLSGAILIDFAGLSSRRRATLEPDLRAALTPDPLRPRLLGFTYLGLAEIVRPRIRPPLHELLCGPLAAGLAALRQVIKEATPARRPVLAATDTIISALQADPAALPELAQQTLHPIIMQSDPSLSGWHLEFRDA